jgi:hypothetical protein
VLDFGLEGGTASSFHTNKQGEVKLLKVKTFGELIRSSGIVVTECDDDPELKSSVAPLVGRGSSACTTCR